MDHMTGRTTDIAMGVGGRAPMGAQVGCGYFMALQAEFRLFGRCGGLARDRHPINRTEAENGRLPTTPAPEVLTGRAVALFAPLLAMHIRAERGYKRLVTDHALSVEIGEFRAGHRRERDLHRPQRGWFPQPFAFSPIGG